MPSSSKTSGSSSYRGRASSQVRHVAITRHWSSHDARACGVVRRREVVVANAVGAGWARCAERRVVGPAALLDDRPLVGWPSRRLPSQSTTTYASLLKALVMRNVPTAAALQLRRLLCFRRAPSSEQSNESARLWAAPGEPAARNGDEGAAGSSARNCGGMRTHTDARGRRLAATARERYEAQAFL